MQKRKAITKKVRFEVFKRDSFKCQYCGRSAPDVLLRVDHMHPVAKGGDNEIINLITACFDCNSGKSDVLIDDQAAIVRQREQLEALNDRRSQLEMMLHWRDELRKIDERSLDAAADLWSQRAVGFRLTGAGRNKLQILVTKFGLGEVLSSIDLVCDKWLEFIDGNATQESSDVAFSKISGTCYVRSLGDSDRRLHYIRGICRNRFANTIGYECLNLLKEAVALGADIDRLEDWAKQAPSWYEWRATMIFGIEHNSTERNGGNNG